MARRWRPAPPSSRCEPGPTGSPSSAPMPCATPRDAGSTSAARSPAISSRTPDTRRNARERARLHPPRRIGRAPRPPRRRRARARRARRASDDPRAGGEPARHRGLAGARPHAAAHRRRFRLSRQRRAGPRGQARRRQYGDEPARRGRRPVRRQRVPRPARTQGDRDELPHRTRLFARRDAHAQGQPRRGVRLSAARAERAALRLRGGGARARGGHVAAAAGGRGPGRGGRREALSPNEMANRSWWATAFPGHPYGLPVNGTLESVPKITIDDLKSYTRRALARDNVKIAIVGDIDAETAGALIDRAFGALPA